MDPNMSSVLLETDDMDNIHDIARVVFWRYLTPGGDRWRYGFKFMKYGEVALLGQGHDDLAGACEELRHWLQGAIDGKVLEPIKPKIEM